MDKKEIVESLTLYDDVLMSRVFDQNKEATELFLGIVLGSKVTVASVVGQTHFKNPEVGGRNITLDVHAIDEHGQEMDIEVQGNSPGADIKRARYHSSMLDSRMLKEGQDFRKLKDSYVIFMYKHDKFGEGLPLYHIERYVDETGKPVRDGSHIIYVNGNYKGDDQIGKLISDFHQVNPKAMNYKELATGVDHFKETEGGNEDMSELLDAYVKEREQVKAVEYVNQLMKNLKFTLEEALNVLGIQGEEREQIMKQIMG